MAHTGLPEEASKISTPDQVRGLEAGGAGVRIEHRQLLLAVGGIVGVVDVERDPLGWFRPAAAEQIDEAEPDLDQRPPVGQVLKPGQRRDRKSVV